MSALFQDLIGQPLAVDLLSAALAQGRVAPAYLFAGPEGVGRQLAAVRFLEDCWLPVDLGGNADACWNAIPICSGWTHLSASGPFADPRQLKAGLSRRTPPSCLEQIPRSVLSARQPVEAKRGMVD